MIRKDLENKFNDYDVDLDCFLDMLAVWNKIDISVRLRWIMERYNYIGPHVDQGDLGEEFLHLFTELSEWDRIKFLVLSCGETED